MFAYLKWVLFFSISSSASANTWATDDDDVPNASYVQIAGMGSSPPRDDESDELVEQYPELFEKYKVVKMIGEGIFITLIIMELLN